MKILLTGKPKSGKTTLLKVLIDDTDFKQGFVTEQILKDDVRTGFELVSAEGVRETLADIDSKSHIRVSRYGVNVEQFDTFLSGLPPLAPGKLIYVDEIGQMELYSDYFKKLIETYLSAPNPYLGTITSVYTDVFVDKIINREDILLIEINDQNRSMVHDALDGFISNIGILQSLDVGMIIKLTDMAKEYVSKDRYIQLKKLFKNAVVYIAESRVTPREGSRFMVSGNHGNHNVCLTEAKYACDCSLFNGEDKYYGNAGECSHIQAVKLTANL